VARAEKPRLVVVPFTGPTAKRAEAVVVRALRRKAQIIPPQRWTAAARKLFASSTKSEDVAAVAEDVGADVVVIGTVKRDGRKHQLLITVRDGKSGKPLERLRYPLARPRLDDRTLALLGEEVERAFATATGEREAAPAAPPTAEPARPTAATSEEPPPTAAAPKRGKRAAAASAPVVRPIDENLDDSPATPTAKSAAAPSAAQPAASVEQRSAGARPRWAPYLDVSAAALLATRDFDFTPASLPRFDGGVVGGLRVDLTLYPFAFSYATARGVFATLGFGAVLDVPFWPPSGSLDGNKYDTNELRVDAGLRWRFVLYRAIPRPELILLAGYGLHRFSIAKRPDGSDVGPPDVAYSQVTVGAGFRIYFAEWARLWLSFRAGLLLDAGPVTAPEGYGPATAYGLRPEAGLDFFVWRGLKIGAGFFFHQVSFTFLGSDPPPAKPGGGAVAGSAVDRSMGGLLGLGYEY
jgi:hypothetical protein